MKNRILFKQLREKERRGLFKVSVLTGARQTGKTTLIKKAFPGYEYILLDDPILREEYTKLTAKDWYRQFPYSILDEVQKSLSLFDTIKAVIDENDNAGYLLLGSSQILLLKEITETLAGRANILELFPLTLPEIITTGWEEEIEKSVLIKFLEDTGKNELFRQNVKLDNLYEVKQKNFFDFLKYGGMPRIIDEKLSDDEKYEWLYNYNLTYLQRDLRDLAEVKELSGFIKAQKALSNNTGNLLNTSSISNLSGISTGSARRYISYLELSYQVVFLPSWSKNQNKRLSKSPKVHFLDPGIQRTIINRRGEMTGNEFESAVVAEIFKQVKSHSLPIDLYHLRTVDGREVDILLESEHGFIPVEIKQTDNVRPTDARHLRDLETILNKKIVKSIIISNDPEIKQFGEDIIAVPGFWFLT